MAAYLPMNNAWGAIAGAQDLRHLAGLFARIGSAMLGHIAFVGAQTSG